jgi:hypothetical protein
VPSKQRAQHSYIQLGIGDCGHVVETWPLLTSLANTNPRVFCDDCTRLKYGIDNGEQFVTVGLKSKPKPKYDETDPDMPTPPAKRVAKPRKPRSVLDTLLAQEGLF